MALNDIYRVVLKGAMLGQQVINVFGYKLTDDGGGAGPFSDELATVFKTTVMPPILDAVSSALEFDQLEIQNLNSLSDFVVDALSGFIGTRSAIVSPSFTTWSYQLRPATKLLKWGRKGFGGVAEGDTDGNEPSALVLPQLATLSGALVLPLAGPGTIRFVPVIYRRAVPEVLPYKPLHDVVTEVIFRGIGTQLSRRKGNGA